MTTDSRTTADPLDAAAWKLYELAVGDEDARLCKDITDAQCQEQPGNFVRQTLALTFSKIGDGLADAKVVLPWLLGVLGAPGFMVGLLVPVRESLALLPQLFVGGAIRRFAVRKWFWVWASVVEGACMLGMAAVALAGVGGAPAGWAVVALLFVFSAARGVASIASKDTLGKTVSRTRRGRVSGFASSAAGIVAGLVGLYLVVTPAEARPTAVLYVIIAAAGVSWLLAAAVFATTREHPGATEGGRGIVQVLRGQLAHLMRDAELRKFLVGRALLLGIALAGPVYVALAQQTTDGTLAGLGALVVASGLAGAVSSAVWGRLSDRSSRRAMVLAAMIAGVLGLAVAAAVALGGPAVENIWFYAAVLFVLGIAHAGVRIGRKTHLVDMAGDDRAEYVAVSNTLIGVLLLVAGAVVGAVMAWSLTATIVLLAVLALGGAAACAALREVQS